MAAGGAKATNATTTAAAGTTSATSTNGSHGDWRDGSGWCNCD
jgi:hypothetical protein